MTALIHIEIVKALEEKKSGISRKELFKNFRFLRAANSKQILDELEESGFIAAHPEFHKKVKDKRLWLMDEYSYFYLTWIERTRLGILMGHDHDYWLKMGNDPRWKTWAGYAFESICFKHIAQIKKALGISAILTSESQWIL